MIRIREAIIVEGRYDKNTLAQVVDAPILETSGFGIFHDSQRLALLRRLAETRGIIVLTDSDGAGFVIRNYLRGAIDPAQVKHAYIPDQYGKERRKRAPGKAGKLGVEGMRPEVLERALRRRAGADASLLWIPERLRPMLHRSGGFLRRTRRLWLVWLAWAVLLAGLWFLADGQLDRVLAPWIARYGEELVQSGFPESWTILRGRLEADVALWLRLRQGVLIAGAVSGAGVLVWTLLHWKKRRPPLAEEGET